MNSGPLQEQQLHLTADPSPQASHMDIFHLKIGKTYLACMGEKD